MTLCRKSDPPRNQSRYQFVNKIIHGKQQAMLTRRFLVPMNLERELLLNIYNYVELMQQCCWTTQTRFLIGCSAQVVQFSDSVLWTLTGLPHCVKHSFARWKNYKSFTVEELFRACNDFHHDKVFFFQFSRVHVALIPSDCIFCFCLLIPALHFLLYIKMLFIYLFLNFV